MGYLNPETSNPMFEYTIEVFKSKNESQPIHFGNATSTQVKKIAIILSFSDHVKKIIARNNKNESFVCFEKGKLTEWSFDTF